MLRYLERGVTLLELLVTLTVIAIVFSVGVPLLERQITQANRSELAMTYRSLFAFARSQSVVTGTVVTVCPLSQQSNKCTDDWSLPASVFPDADNDKTPDGGAIWRTFTPVSSYRIRSRTGGRGSISFAPNGMVHGASGSLVACPEPATGGPPMAYLAVNRGGRFRSQFDEDGDNRITLSWGAQLHCSPSK